ncbi:MAG: PDZ domain-containing protein [Deltaproteobacteria bacterium]|nr:PDZ domain-containing protein [Deltaproteobacteria bacterium]
MKRLVFALALSLVCAACSGPAAEWTGSVDAVLRYRPSDRSTVAYKVRPGSMSEKAGMKPGDRVMRVDGVDISEAPYEEVKAALRGPIGTSARVEVQRDKKIIEILIERRPLHEAEDKPEGD